jgi:hypothetical protein
MGWSTYPLHTNTKRKRVSILRIPERDKEGRGLGRVVFRIARGRDKGTETRGGREKTAGDEESEEVKLKRG